MSVEQIQAKHAIRAFLADEMKITDKQADPAARRLTAMLIELRVITDRRAEYSHSKLIAERNQLREEIAHLKAKIDTLQSSKAEAKYLPAAKRNIQGRQGQQ